MLKLNIHEAKTHLSRYLKRISRGETILLCKRNVPIAEIKPLQLPWKDKRSIGLAKGRFRLPAEFSEPLPEEVLHAFQGKGS